MKFENTEVWGFEHALRGMRNPMNSWGKSDSVFRYAKSKDPYKMISDAEIVSCCKIGENDMKLAKSLVRAGEPHRKFLRQIFVSVDITAPLYWWKEFDTYKVGTVANSTSTMHKLASTPITLDCFEMDDYYAVPEINMMWKDLIDFLEILRKKNNELIKDARRLEEIKEFDESKKATLMAKKYWKELIRLLPESWLQTRTITMNYENVLNMVKYRMNHKLTEWSESFMKWVKSLPYANEFIFINNK